MSTYKIRIRGLYLNIKLFMCKREMVRKDDEKREKSLSERNSYNISC